MSENDATKGGASSAPAQVLVAASLEPFLREEDMPADVAVTLFDEAGPLPAGDWRGVIPTVAYRVDAATIRRFRHLSIIANYGVGYDNIDVVAAEADGITVTNTPGVLTDATAELTWALILAAARRLPEGERLARSGEWTGWRPTQLLGTTLGGRLLGVVGAGRIGSEVARRAAAFGMRVCYAGRRRRTELEQETGATHMPLDDLLGQSDVVSLHVALTSETHHLIDSVALGRMKPSAILVNTARGAVVDESALIGVLREGRIRAAALDVYENEPRVPAELRELPNVVLLPHLGSATEQARRAMWCKAWTNLLLGVRGEPVQDPVVGGGAAARGRLRQ